MSSVFPQRGTKIERFDFPPLSKSKYFWGDKNNKLCSLQDLGTANIILDTYKNGGGGGEEAPLL